MLEASRSAGIKTDIGYVGDKQNIYTSKKAGNLEGVFRRANMSSVEKKVYIEHV